jgi:hypothetical protein
MGMYCGPVAVAVFPGGAGGSWTFGGRVLDNGT